MTWRRRRDEGALIALSRPRGRKPGPPLEKENQELGRRLTKTEAEPAKARIVIEVQGKAPLSDVPAGHLTETPRPPDLEGLLQRVVICRDPFKHGRRQPCLRRLRVTGDSRTRRLRLLAAMVVGLIAVAIPLCTIDACTPFSPSMPDQAMTPPSSSPALHAGSLLAAVGCDLIAMTRDALAGAATPGTVGPLPLLLSGLALLTIAAPLLRRAPKQLAAAHALPSAHDLRGVRLLN